MCISNHFRFMNRVNGCNDIVIDNDLKASRIVIMIDYRIIKWLVDAGLLQDCRMILSGSSSVSLKKSGEFMPGRRKNGKDIQTSG